MNLEQKLEEAKAKRRKVMDQVNAVADEINNLRQQRQALLHEALRFDGECRTLEALVKEEKEK